MKKIFIALVCLVAISGIFAQSISIVDFEDEFTGFIDTFSSTLTLNSTIGNTWSDSYIGNFAHLGAGVTIGFTATDPESSAPLFDLFNYSLPEWATSVGVPIPSLAANAKLGLFFLPIDIGFKYGFIPDAFANWVDPIQVEYNNFGVSVRARVLEDNFLLPEISLGGSVNYIQGEIRTPIGSSQTISYTDGGASTWTLDFSEPELVLGWKTTTADFTAQISKTLLFILTPYAGAGITVGNSSVSGGVKSEMTVSGGTIEDLKTALAAAGQPVPDFDANGFVYTKEDKNPVIRIYGGLSLNLFVLITDIQAMYVPATKNFGASANFRIQL